MIKQKRYLITTYDENTWKFDRPAIFLGEWCRLYNRKHIWKNMDVIVSEPYGLEHSKRDSDFSKTILLENKLFPEFIQLLNNNLGKQYSERFWMIILGPWFKFIIKDLFYRINSVNECLASHEISGTTIYDCEKYLLTPDTWDKAVDIDQDIWKSNLIYASILNLLKNKNFHTELIPLKINDIYQGPFSVAKKIEKKSFYKNFLKIGLKIYNKLSNTFVGNNDAFIINTFLPTKEEAKLELALGQFPQFWKYKWSKYNQPELVKKLPDKLLRESLKKQFSIKCYDNVENTMRQLFFELLPTCYLEGFEDLYNIVKKQPWPKSPKFIFTSNNFYFDEIFKLYAALNVEAGSKYYVGQHGGNYGTQRHKSPRTEEVTSDKFITWGWTDGMPQHKPAFILKNAGKKKLNFNPLGNLLLIEHGYTKSDATYDKKFFFIQYLNNQQKFINHLDKKPRKKLIVRLFNIHYQNKELHEESRWFDFDPNIKIDKGISKIDTLISKSRLVVHSYDSTGILETLSDNIPTLAFWGPEVALVDSAKPYYQLLIDAGIVHLSAKSVADKINEIWDDIDSWWKQSNVQDARLKFCNRYAKKSQKPITELKQILLS